MVVSTSEQVHRILEIVPTVTQSPSNQWCERCIRFDLDTTVMSSSPEKIDCQSAGFNFCGRQFCVRLRCLEAARASEGPQLFGFLVMRSSFEAPKEPVFDLWAGWEVTVQTEAPTHQGKAMIQELVCFDRRPCNTGDMSVHSQGVRLALTRDARPVLVTSRDKSTIDIRLTLRAEGS